MLEFPPKKIAIIPNLPHWDVPLEFRINGLYMGYVTYLQTEYISPGLPPPLKSWLTHMIKPLGKHWWLY